MRLVAFDTKVTGVVKQRKRQKNVKYAKGILHLLCNKYKAASKAYLLGKILLGTADTDNQLTDPGYKYIIFLYIDNKMCM